MGFIICIYYASRYFHFNFTAAQSKKLWKCNSSAKVVVLSSYSQLVIHVSYKIMLKTVFIDYRIYRYFAPSLPCLIAYVRFSHHGHHAHCKFVLIAVFDLYFIMFIIIACLFYYKCTRCTANIKYDMFWFCIMCSFTSLETSHGHLHKLRRKFGQILSKSFIVIQLICRQNS